MKLQALKHCVSRGRFFFFFVGNPYSSLRITAAGKADQSPSYVTLTACADESCFIHATVQWPVIFLQLELVLPNVNAYLFSGSPGEMQKSASIQSQNKDRRYRNAGISRSCCHLALYFLLFIHICFCH